MSVTIDLTQTQTIIPGETEEDGPQYRVTNLVTRSEGISRAIFVMNTETDVFEHVATVWHMNYVPGSKEEAQLEGSPYYRADTAYRQYDSVGIAIDFAEYTRARVSGLAQAYDDATGEFPGTFNYVLTDE